MALNSKRLDRSKQSTTRGGGQFLKLQDGKNYIRLFSFPHEVEAQDFKKGFYKPNDGIEAGETYDELEREVYIHFGEDGAENCIRKGCEKCSEAKELLESDSKADKKLGQEMKANKRFYVNCVDMNNPDAGMQICPMPTSAFADVLTYVTDPEFGESVLGIKGRDFVITKDPVAGKNDPGKYYSVLLRDREKSVVLSKDLKESVTDLFTLAVLEPGWSKDSGGAPDTGTKKGTAKSKKDETDDDDSEIDAKKEQASASASRSAASSKTKPKEDEDEPPRSSAKSKGSKEEKEDDNNPFRDKDAEADGDGGLPWEKNGRAKPKGSKAKEPEEEMPDFVVKGATVVFENDSGVPETGEIVEINADDRTCEVETDKSVWTLKFSEMKKPAGKPRRSK